MGFFTKKIIVSNDDLDELAHVNNVRYVQWIQDVSKEHWQSKAPTAIQKESVWVVMNHHITYLNAAKLNDEIEVSTHIDESRGATSVRIVEMRNLLTNQPLLRSRTEWCLLNANSLKPMRISEAIKTIFSAPD